MHCNWEQFIDAYVYEFIRVVFSLILLKDTSLTLRNALAK